jgi:hypothetical protein
MYNAQGWSGNAMAIKELEVYVTTDGLGRAAIRLTDSGLFDIYIHWKLSKEIIGAGIVTTQPDYAPDWFEDETPLDLLYEDRQPEIERLITLGDARNRMRLLRGFSDARILYTNLAGAG